MKQGGFHYIGNQIKSHCPHHWPLKVKSLSHVRLFVTPWTVAYQAPLSMGFSRQGYWSGVLFPSPGHLPNPGIEPKPSTLQVDSLPPETAGKPNWSSDIYLLMSLLSNSFCFIQTETLRIYLCQKPLTCSSLYLDGILTRLKKQKEEIVEIILPYILGKQCISENSQTPLLIVLACMLSRFSRVRPCATQWTVAYQAPLSMGFSKQKYWSGFPCPPPGDLPDPGFELASLTSLELAGRFVTISITSQVHSFSLYPVK